MMRLNLVSILTNIVSISFCIYYRNVAYPIKVGLLLVYLRELADNLIWFFWCLVDCEIGMINYKRCMKITEVCQERFKEGQTPPPNWPTRGEVEFRDYTLRYRPETERVLKGLSFGIKAGEKIGIVGRTGAGKSTICLALCRVVEAESGSILIDGKKISDIELAALRSRITIIPQDPTLFSATLRFNLDPNGENSDDKISSLLRKACLSDLLDRDPLGLDMKIE